MAETVPSILDDFDDPEVTDFHEQYPASSSWPEIPTQATMSAQDTLGSTKTRPGFETIFSTATTASETLTDDRAPRAYGAAKRGKQPAPLSPDQTEYCAWWYDHLNTTLDSSLRPENVTSSNEQHFARRLHYVVRSYLSSPDVNYLPPPLLRPELVQANLDEYYQLFPPVTDETAGVRKSRHRHQNGMLDVVRPYFYLFSEIQELSAIRRALFERRHQHATRATFALLSAYGMTLSQTREDDLF